MEQAVFTTLCMVLDGKGNVLVQRRKGARWPGVAFPGGHVEPGEAFTQCAVREVYEETGYTLQDPVLCGVKQMPLENGGRYVIFLYRATRFSGSLRPSEEGPVFWTPLETLARLPLSREMLLAAALIQNAGKSELFVEEDRQTRTVRML